MQHEKQNATKRTPKTSQPPGSTRGQLGQVLRGIKERHETWAVGVELHGAHGCEVEVHTRNGLPRRAQRKANDGLDGVDVADHDDGLSCPRLLRLGDKSL